MSHSRLAIFFWLSSIFVLLSVIVKTPFTTDMSAFLPRAPSPEQQLLVDQLRDGVASRLILIGIEGATPAVRSAISRDLTKWLHDRSEFELIDNGEASISKADADYVWRNRYVLSSAVNPAHFSEAGLRQALQRDLELLASAMEPLLKDSIVHDPTGEALSLGRTFAGDTRREIRDGVWTSQDGARALVVAQTRAAGFDIDAQEQAWAAVKLAFAQAQRKIEGGTEVRLLTSGPGIFGVKTRAEMKHDVSMYSMAAVTVIVTILLLLYRSLRVLALTLVPVISGALAGLAAVCLWSGFVHGITVGFGVTLIGESVDYAIYVFVQSKGQGGTQASLARIWPTLRIGALVSACGFLSMLFSSFTGFVQLGIFTIVGLASALTVTRFILPSVVPQGFAWTRDIAFAPTLLSLVNRASRLRVPLILLTGIALLFIVSERDRLWQDDLASMSPISAADQSLDRALRQDMGAPDVRYVVIASAKDQESVLDICERAGNALEYLIADRTLTGYDGPCRYLPSDKTQRARKAALPKQDILHDNLAQALAGLPFAPQVFSPFLDDVAAARVAPLLRRDSLAGTALAFKLDSLLLARNDQWIATMPLSGVTEPEHIMATLASRGLSGQASLLDLKAESDRLLERYRHESLVLASLGSIVIAALLLIHFRSFRQCAVVLMPLVVALIITIAILILEHGQLSLFNVFGFLLVVAVGSNYCLFFQRGDMHGDHGGRTATSLLVANICTVIGFGALSISRIPVLFDLGSTVAIGTALSLVAAAILAPGLGPIQKPELPESSL